MTHRRDINRRSMAGRLAGVVMSVLTIAAAGLLACACLARVVSPERVWPLAFAGMAAPILYVANLALLLYWTMRWRWCALMPAAALLIGGWWVSLFFKPTLGRDRAEEYPDADVVVMSYNVAGFLSVDDPQRRTSTLDSVAATVRRADPDILCIQEYQSMNEAQKPHVDSLLGLPNEVHNYRVVNAAGGGWGLAIHTRHRIVGSGVVDFEGTTNSAMWADLAVAGDTLRIFNCHLQTTSIKREDLDYIMGEEHPSDVGRVGSIVARLRYNFGIRAAQADSLAPLIESSPHPVIVCGDFNDTPMSYVYRRIRGSLSDTFVEAGRGIPSTYRGLFNMLRIDYIFTSRSLRTVFYYIPPDESSDHRPVVTGIDTRA